MGRAAGTLAPGDGRRSCGSGAGSARSADGRRTPPTTGWSCSRPSAASRRCARPCRVRLVTDSTYVRDGITRWIANWKRRGWRTASGQPVKNVDLWQRLDAAATGHEIDWVWTRGHSGHPENERVDRRARAEAAAVGSGAGSDPRRTRSPG